MSDTPLRKLWRIFALFPDDFCWYSPLYITPRRISPNKNHRHFFMKSARESLEISKFSDIKYPGVQPHHEDNSRFHQPLAKK
jgi:hypothetical protein